MSKELICHGEEDGGRQFAAEGYDRRKSTRKHYEMMTQWKKGKLGGLVAGAFGALFILMREMINLIFGGSTLLSAVVVYTGLSCHALPQ